MNGDTTKPTTLTLEIKEQDDRTGRIGPALLSPALGDDYWVFRVPLSPTQAIVAFPKFGTYGIGFAVEDDWNTNLPHTCDAEEIYDHIERNKGDDSISRADCLTAIRMIQAAVANIG